MTPQNSRSERPALARETGLREEFTALSPVFPSLSPVNTGLRLDKQRNGRMDTKPGGLPA